MTRAPATCRCDDTIEAALEGMLSRCVRHLVVVDDHGAVAGVLSFEDSWRTRSRGRWRFVSCGK